MKRLTIVVAAILAFLLLVSCGGSPAAAPKSSPAGQKTKLGIAAGRPADPYFVLSYGLSTLINQYSTKFSAEPVATSGIANNYLLLINDASKRANTMFVWASSARLDPKYNGQKGYDPRHVGLMFARPGVFMTFDKNIKSIKDLKGKSIGVGRNNTFLYYFVDSLVKQTGIASDVKLFPGSVGERLNALGDGIVQATWETIEWEYPNKFFLGPQVEEVMRGREMYYFGVDSETVMQQAIDASMKGDPAVAGYHAFYLPAGALKNVDSAILAPSYAYQWGADATMPVDTVYEITKILYEHADELGKFHIGGRGITKDFLPRSDDFGQTEQSRQQSYHPGALKFYNEVGVKEWVLPRPSQKK